jgi:SAGA-associated factor 29
VRARSTSNTGRAAGNLYEVQDEEAEPNTTNRYFLEAHNVLPLPRTSIAKDERVLAPGTAVLGVFPGTTTFYRATVLASPRRTPTGEFDAYTLQFEDDDEVESGRLVDFRYVVAARSAKGGH